MVAVRNSKDYIRVLLYSSITGWGFLLVHTCTVQGLRVYGSGYTCWVISQHGLTLRILGGVYMDIYTYIYVTARVWVGAACSNTPSANRARNDTLEDGKCWAVLQLGKSSMTEAGAWSWGILGLGFGV